MPHKKVIETNERQLDPDYVTVADEVGHEKPDRYIECRDPAVFRMSSNAMVRQADLKWAEDAAHAMLLYLGMHFPPDPLMALRRLERVNVFTYREAATAMGLMHTQFERLYGFMDGFTVRHQDKDGVAYYAVAYRPRELASRERFTLAHELGHVVLGHFGTYTADEREADHFASCFLAPRIVMEDLPRDRELAKRCYITAAAAMACRCRRPQRTNSLFESLLRLWYKWEQQYSRMCKEYVRLVNERFPGRPERITAIIDGQRYEVEKPGYRVIQAIDPEVAYWRVMTPSYLPDVVFGFDEFLGEFAWDIGRRRGRDEEDRVIQTECPRKDSCACGDACVIENPEMLEGIEEFCEGDRINMIQCDLATRITMCPFLTIEPEGSARPGWIANSAKDVVRLSGKPQNNSRKSRKKG